MSAKLSEVLKLATESISMNLSTNVKENDIPFDVDDPFYSKENTEHLLKVIRAVDSGKAKLTCHDIVGVD